jgi:hypothetical protein
VDEGKWMRCISYSYMKIEVEIVLRMEEGKEGERWRG